MILMDSCQTEIGQLQSFDVCTADLQKPRACSTQALLCFLKISSRSLDGINVMDLSS